MSDNESHESYESYELLGFDNLLLPVGDLGEAVSFYER